MKKFIAIIVLFAVSITVTTYAEGEETPIALVKKIVRDVTYRPDVESDWELAKTGTPLSDGEEVKTGSRSLALVLFTDGSGILRVRENSLLHVYGKAEKESLSKNTFIQRGELGFEINKVGDEEFKFTTPTAVASIRGTAGYIGVGEDSTTTIVVEEGIVEVESTTGEGERKSINAGSTASINNRGTVTLNTSSDEDKNKLNSTKRTSTETIKIETDEGTIEIEYYTDDK